MKAGGDDLAIQSRATKRAKEKPTTLAARVPIIESAKAMGHGQMSGAARTKTVPGTPKGWSTVYAPRKAT